MSTYDVLLPVNVGVWLRREMTPDMADPGLGLGLGLYMNSESILVSEFDCTNERWSFSRLPDDDTDADMTENEPPPADSDVVVVVVGSMWYDTPPLSPLNTITDRSKRSSFRVEAREPLADVR